jgi:hypothetical protein
MLYRVQGTMMSKAKLSNAGDKLFEWAGSKARVSRIRAEYRKQGYDVSTSELPLPKNKAELIRLLNTRF